MDNQPNEAKITQYQQPDYQNQSKKADLVVLDSRIGRLGFLVGIIYLVAILIVPVSLPLIVRLELIVMKPVTDLEPIFIVFIISSLLEICVFVLLIPRIIRLFVRRLHDVNRSGKFVFLILIPFFNLLLFLYLLLKPGTAGVNQYGATIKSFNFWVVLGYKKPTEVKMDNSLPHKTPLEQPLDMSKVVEQTNRKSKKFHLLMILILILVFSLFIIGYIVSRLSNEPSSSGLNYFDNKQVAALAIANKNYIQAKFKKIPMTSNGFTLLTSSYSDGCYSNNAVLGLFQTQWQKDCIGMAVYYYGSKGSVYLSTKKLLKAFHSVNYRTYGGLTHTYTPGCYFGTIYIKPVKNQNTWFQLSTISNLTGGCTWPVQWQTVSATATTNEAVQYSRLTTPTIQQNLLIQKMRSEGYTVLIIMGKYRTYFSKPMDLISLIYP